MTPVVLFVVFVPSVGWGFAAWLYTHLRDRRQLARAFAHGRAEGVVRLPVRTTSAAARDAGDAA